MNDLFNEEMSYAEAQKIFFRECDGKPNEVINRIFSEYSRVLEKIIERELKENEGWMTSIPVSYVAACNAEKPGE